jgi:hypothetical protein
MKFLYKLKLIFLGLAEVILALKVVPSIITLGYGFFCWEVWLWFSALKSPEASQTAAFSTVFGLAAAIFGFYINSGLKDTDWDKIEGIIEDTKNRIGKSPGDKQ